MGILEVEEVKGRSRRGGSRIEGGLTIEGRGSKVEGRGSRIEDRGREGEDEGTK